jgi:hypothetical protein
MSDLGDELRETIDGAATPVTFDEIVGRSAVDHPRAAPWQTILVAAVVVVALVAAAFVVADLGDGGESSKPHIAAPTVAVGDIDLAVLSTSFDDDGARGPIDPGVVDTVRSIPGVAGAQGAMQRIVDVVRTDSTPDTQPPASERSAIAISWEDGAPLTFSAGSAPQGAGEIAINQSLAAQYQVGVDDELVLNTGATMGGGIVRRVLPSGEVEIQQARPSGSTARVVGVFTPAGGDVDDINLVLMRADDLGTATNRPSFDRVDIVADPAVPIDELLDRVSAALPIGTMVVPPSVVGFDEQLRAELEIQRAYHWVLNPDRARGRAAVFGAPDDPASMARNQQTYDANLWQTVNTELRVSRVAFVDNATALVTYRAYYGGVPSGVVRTPMTGVAERIDGEWRLSQAGLCELGQAANVQCAGTGGPTASAFAAPPNGWNAVDSAPGAVAAFRLLADPTTTVDQRVLAIDQGPRLRDAVEAGVRADVARTNAVSFNVSGARLLDATHAQVLYSVIADGDPRLETPYPLVGNAVLVDGTWKVASRFACGLTALATLSCPAAAALPTTSTSSTTTTGPPSTSVAPTTINEPTPTSTVPVPTSIAP